MTAAEWSYAVFALRAEQGVLSDIPDIIIFDEGKKLPFVARCERLQQYSSKQQALVVAYMGFHLAACRLAPAQGTSMASSELCGLLEVIVGSMLLTLDLYASALLQNCMDVMTKLHGQVRHEAREHHVSHDKLSMQGCCEAVLAIPAKRQRSVWVSKQVGWRAMVSMNIIRFNLLIFLILHACLSYLFGEKGLGAALVAVVVVVSVLIASAFAWGDYAMSHMGA